MIPCYVEKDGQVVQKTLTIEEYQLLVDFLSREN